MTCSLNFAIEPAPAPGKVVGGLLSGLLVAGRAAAARSSRSKTEEETVQRELSLAQRQLEVFAERDAAYRTEVAVKAGGGGECLAVARAPTPGPRFASLANQPPPRSPSGGCPAERQEATDTGAGSRRACRQCEQSVCGNAS